MAACALHDEPAGAEPMPTVDEQRAFLDHLSAAAEVAPAPDLGMSVLDALEYLTDVTGGCGAEGP